MTSTALMSNSFAKTHQHAGCDTCVHLGDGNSIGRTSNQEAVPDSDDDEKASKGQDNASGDPSDADS